MSCYHTESWKRYRHRKSVFCRGLHTMKMWRQKKIRNVLCLHWDLNWISFAWDVSSFFWTVTINGDKVTDGMEFDCDNINMTKCGICCIVELWLEVQQRCAINCAVTSNVNDQSYNVMTSVWRAFSHNSTQFRRHNTTRDRVTDGRTDRQKCRYHASLCWRTAIKINSV